MLENIIWIKNSLVYVYVGEYIRKRKYYKK